MEHGATNLGSDIAALVQFPVQVDSPCGFFLPTQATWERCCSRAALQLLKLKLVWSGLTRVSSSGIALAEVDVPIEVRSPGVVQGVKQAYFPGALALLRQLE